MHARFLRGTSFRVAKRHPEGQRPDGT